MNRSAQSSKRTITIFAGPNGAGKSTLREIWRYDVGVVIDTDQIAREAGMNDLQLNFDTILDVTRACRPKFVPHAL